MLLFHPDLQDSIQVSVSNFTMCLNLWYGRCFSVTPESLNGTQALDESVRIYSQIHFYSQTLSSSFIYTYSSLPSYLNTYHTKPTFGHYAFCNHVLHFTWLCSLRYPFLHHSLYPAGHYSPNQPANISHLQVKLTFARKTMHHLFLSSNET